MKLADYSTFSSDLHDHATQGPERVPLEGMIELTRLCSVKCVHCYIGDARWVKDPEELTTIQIKELLDALAARGTLWLCFTGGEAMLRRDFKEIWVYAKQKGFILTLFSNATLIDESMADFLYEYPPFSLEISIYGATQETYELVTQVKGSFARFMRGISNVKRLGLAWKLKTVLIKESAHELEMMKSLAHEWGVPFKFDGNINPSIGEGQTGGQAPCATRVETEELIDAVMSNTSEVEEAKALVEKQNGHGVGENLFSCGAGENTFYISARGELQMCILTGHRGQSLKTQNSMSSSFEAGWNRFAQFREIKRAPDSPCTSCDIAVLCDSCPGMAHLETGDEQSVVEFFCRSAHLKAKAMGVKHKCDIKHFVYRNPNLRKHVDDGKEKISSPVHQT